MAEKLTPEYLDFIYRNTGGKMGKPMQSAPQQPVAPPVEQPQRRKYELPENRLSKFLVALGGGNPANIDQMALAAEQHRSLYDPESERSRIARDIAMKVGAPATPDLTAGDIESFLPSYERLLALKAKGQAGGPKEKKYTESQSKYGLHAGSLENALYNLDKLKASGYDPSTAWQSIQGSQYYPEFLKTEDRKLFDQAATDLGMAATFVKSGAAAPAQESRAIGATYADRPGDSPAVKEQKRIDRELFLNQVNAASGGMGEEIINRNRQLRTQLEQSPVNVSTGSGDVTKESWVEPNGARIDISPTDPNYSKVISILQKKGGKRVQ
jgi:hypothetical protein